MLQSVFYFRRLLQTMRYYINGHDEIAELYEDFLEQEGFAGTNEGFDFRENGLSRQSFRFRLGWPTYSKE